MRAVRLVAPRELQLVEVPDPAPAPGWAVLDVEAAGLCHSDAHALHGHGAGSVFEP